MKEKCFLLLGKPRICGGAVLRRLCQLRCVLLRRLFGSLERRLRCRQRLGELLRAVPSRSLGVDVRLKLRHGFLQRGKRPLRCRVRLRKRCAGQERVCLFCGGVPVGLQLAVRGARRLTGLGRAVALGLRGGFGFVHLCLCRRVGAQAGGGGVRRRAADGTGLAGLQLCRHQSRLLAVEAAAQSFGLCAQSVRLLLGGEVGRLRVQIVLFVLPEQRERLLERAKRIGAMLVFGFLPAQLLQGFARCAELGVLVAHGSEGIALLLRRLFGCMECGGFFIVQVALFLRVFQRCLQRVIAGQRRLLRGDGFCERVSLVVVACACLQRGCAFRFRQYAGVFFFLCGLKLGVRLRLRFGAGEEGCDCLMRFVSFFLRRVVFGLRLLVACDLLMQPLQMLRFEQSFLRRVGGRARRQIERVPAISARLFQRGHFVPQALLQRFEDAGSEHLAEDRLALAGVGLQQTLKVALREHHDLGKLPPVHTEDLRHGGGHAGGECLHAPVGAGQLRSGCLLR